MSVMRAVVFALFLGAAVAAGASPPLALAGTAIGEIHLSAAAMRHILLRHGPETTAPGTGKYAPGATPAAIRALIAEAVRLGRTRPDTQGRPDTLYDYRFPQIVGTTVEGRWTHRLRVVVAPDGEIVTAYPR